MLLCSTKIVKKALQGSFWHILSIHSLQTIRVKKKSVIPKITLTFGITIPNFIVIFGIRANYFTKTFLTLPSDILMMAMPFWVLPIFTPLMLKRAASVASFEDISMLAMPEAGS